MNRPSAKRSLVTGAPIGGGREVARRFARQGASVARRGRDVERTERVVAEISAAGRGAFAVVGDLSIAELAETPVASALESLGGRDAVVAAAASTRRSGAILPIGTESARTRASQRDRHADH